MRFVSSSPCQIGGYPLEFGEIQFCKTNTLIVSALTDLQNLFRDLFQLELADLDFGIYRLLRLKREEIETFLTKQLPGHVEKAFQSYAATTMIFFTR